MTHHKRPEISKRMARIEGHVKGIRKMLDDDKSYPEIVQQISAVRGALDSVIVQISAYLPLRIPPSPTVNIQIYLAAL